MLDIIIPVLNRPKRVLPLLENIEAMTDVPHRVLFVCSKGDTAQIAAVKGAGAEHITLTGPPANGQYAKKINLAYLKTKSPWLFLGADDVLFHRGWASAAFRFDKHDVISTNDKANYFVRQGLLATHPIIRREYIDARGGSLDGPGSIYHEGYSHNFVDCEMSVLARERSVFAFARQSVVEHLHPVFRRAPMDETYEVGLKDFDRDRELFLERMRGRERDRLVSRFHSAVRSARRRR